MGAGRRTPSPLAPGRRRVAAGMLAALALTGCGTGGETASPSRTTGASAPTTTSASAPSSPATAKPGGSPRPAQPTVSITVPESLRTLGSGRPILGADVSWPQCPKGMGIPQKRSLGAPMPDASARFVIIGLTNGPGFTPNPCAADQLAWVRARHLYVAAYSVVSYPDAATLRREGSRGPYDAGTRLGRLHNAGYQQAAFNVATMRRIGLRTPIVWVDVEPVPKFDWSPDTIANAAVVRGAVRGYRDAGFGVGAYSTQALWRRVVGDLVLGVPEWRAAGQTSRAEAVRRCGDARMFQGGRSVLSQWVEAGRDRNITCPGTSARMAAWFRLT